MAVSSLKKSTIVRIKLGAMRTGFRTAELLAPKVGARGAMSLWFKTPRPPRAAEVPDGGTAFEVASMGSVVRGTYWGSGPVVYLLHGWGGRGDQLADFVEPLRSSGHRVVMFDALSHGASDPGPSGPGRANAVEFGRALDDVAARFGPARAVVAHSMGAISTMLAIRDGWLGTERLVLIAPMTELTAHFDRFGATVGFGTRVRGRLDEATERLTGYPVEQFSLDAIAAALSPVPPTLALHDRRDRETSYETTARVLESWPDATVVGTDGLGHRRILHDPGVVDATVRHVLAFAEDPDDRADAAA